MADVFRHQNFAGNFTGMDVRNRRVRSKLSRREDHCQSFRASDAFHNRSARVFDTARRGNQHSGIGIFRYHDLHEK